MFKTKIAALTLMALVSTAHATEGIDSKPFNVGTGGPTGNYKGMGDDIQTYCGGADVMGDKEFITAITSGSVENLMGIGSKLYSAAVTQEDVLQYFGKTQPRKYNPNNLKIITPLHLESGHLLVPKNYKPGSNDDGMWSKIASWTGGGSEAPETVSIDMLKGQTIGSWGGSIVSGKAISYFLSLGLDVVEVPEAKRKDPQVPVLLVGGHPYAPVQQLLDTGKYDLIPINFNELQDKAPFYVESKVNYIVEGKVKTVPTFGVRAVFVGKSFRKEERNTIMTNLAKCIDENLPDLADDPDTNPNWESVYLLNESGEQTNWSYFNL
jgi:TRAP-type uncharacterized transport system substrate-binding protein